MTANVLRRTIVGIVCSTVAIDLLAPVLPVLGEVYEAFGQGFKSLAG